MNYVTHTRAAHEALRQQPAARPHHVSLYWALFFQWNASHFAELVELDHETTMQAARIGNKRTYRATLYDLDKWGLIAYQPTQSRHHVSTCRLVNLSGAEVPPLKAATGGRSAPGETGLSGAEVPQALRAEVPPISGLSGAEVPQDSLLDKTSLKPLLQNVGGGPKKKGGQAFQGEGNSSAEVLDDTAENSEAGPHQPDRPAAAPKTSRIKRTEVAPKKKGVRQDHAAADTATPNRPGRRKRPEVPFTESDLATYEQFAAAFAGSDFELADLRFYHLSVSNWRKDGEPPLRRDWKAVATKFMLNDAGENRLKLAPGVRAAKPGIDPADPNNAGIPDVGYRSSRWD